MRMASFSLNQKSLQTSIPQSLTNNHVGKAANVTIVPIETRLEPRSASINAPRRPNDPNAENCGD
jgi:hypothetical protein